MTMQDPAAQPPNIDQDICEIRIQGHLGQEWAEWFGGLETRHEANGDTLLTGRMIDQAALFGVLKKVHSLGLVLISVNFYPAQTDD